MNLKNMREKLKTACNKAGHAEQIFYEGVEMIHVNLIGQPLNPYRAIYEMALSTWGHDIIKWPHATLTERFFIVVQALLGHTLPMSLESAKFTFAIEGCSRAAFDQIARSRIGTAFAAMGIRDNSHYNFPFRIPNFFSKNEKLDHKIRVQVCNINLLYEEIVKEHKGSYQAARCILPMGMCYNFSMTVNYLALKNFCARRMAFCEQEDTVAVAWLLRKAVIQEFPLLGSLLLPACDKADKCFYANNYKMSHLFGELFKPCGRHESNTIHEAEFNHACTDEKVLEDHLGIDCSLNTNKMLNELRAFSKSVTDEGMEDEYRDQVIQEFMTNNIPEKDYRRFQK